MSRPGKRLPSMSEPEEIWKSPRVKENLTSVEFEPTTSGLDLPMLYRLSYEASTSRVLRGSLTIYLYHLYINRDSLPKLPRPAPYWPRSGSNPTEVKFSLTRWDSQISFKGVIPKGDLVYRQYCLLPAPKHILKIIISYFPSATRFPYLIIHMKKLLDSDWLRAVQFKCNTSECKKCNTSANYTS